MVPPLFQLTLLLIAQVQHNGVVR
ncbi:Protein of unknown function [Bacillus wiedmannii]|uniref:Uncharacterized protein n=1 Tax=Bacillus wiedmannii TaxID=1890302 RepID=A0A1C4G3B0_9BACI|nr:Protein of unknown function [Bacillus wiedmannii]SCN10883.1 Protein of unknown function [Bacillus wiedmannii]SCN37509.1 Protein of unknown function [Bacillus cereus]